MTDDAAPLWTASELVAAAHGTLIGSIGLPISGISIDTRTLRPGDVFVALQGPERDGHDFVASALAAGAAAAIVSQEPADLDRGAPLVKVDDVLLALERLGDTARRRAHGKIIGITGSVGKTGTKEMLAAVLAEQAPTHWSAASYNNHWGVPLSLARLPRHVTYAVFELGMNHPGEIAALTRLVRPDIAIITTIEAAHLEFFDGIEGIADAKAEIFLGMTGDGCAILNRDNPLFDRLAAAADARGIQKIISFGGADAADIQLVSCTATQTGSDINARFGKREMHYRLSQSGRHIAMNSLAVLAAAAEAGAELERAAVNLAEVSPLPGRGRSSEIVVAGGTATLIDESYNASPASMRAALAVLAAIDPTASGRRIAVLGDMRELGAESATLHRDLAPAVVDSEVDHLFCCGEWMGELAATCAHLGVAVEHTETAAQLLPLVAAAVRPGDIVLVKGSLGSRMAHIVRPLTARNPEQPAS